MLRKGRQTPTFSTVGEWSKSNGDLACDLFERYGVRFYESQRLEMRVFLARNDDDSYSALTICVSKPRQNGKSFAARFYALWMAAIEGKHVLYSAHHGQVVRKMFRALCTFVESTPDFAAMLKPNGKGVYSAAGSEGIYFVDGEGHDGGFIEFSTRTNNAARGETYQVIVVDEAQELTAEQLEAIKPTQLAADYADRVESDPQMIYIGTPPNVKCAGSEFKRWHDDAHAGRDSSIWWMEWAVDTLPKTTDRAELLELVYETNPAMGYRIKERTMLDAMDTMSPDGFARECLGWWSSTDRVIDHPIRKADWDRCAEPTPERGEPVVYAVKFAPDGSTGALAVCHRNEVPFVYIAEHRSMSGGLAWFVDTLVGVAPKAAQIVVDGQSNAQTLIDRLLDAGVSSRAIIKPKSADIATACSTFANAVVEGRVCHFNQQALNDSATESARRPIGAGGGWGFRSTETADATLVEACALAYWSACTTKRKPGRRAIVF